MNRFDEEYVRTSTQVGTPCVPSVEPIQHRFAGIRLSIAFRQALTHHSTPFRRRYESPLSTKKLACTANVRITIRLPTSHQQHEKYKNTNYTIIDTQAVRSTFIFCQCFREKAHLRFIFRMFYLGGSTRQCFRLYSEGTGVSAKNHYASLVDYGTRSSDWSTLKKPRQHKKCNPKTAPHST